MVFARRKLAIQDKVYHPRRQIKLSYSGKMSNDMYDFIRNLLEKSYMVPEEDIQEKSFETKKLDGGEKVGVKWELVKDMDRFSYIRVTVGATITTVKGNGNVSVILDPVLRTEYPQDSVWQRSVFYEFMRMLWHRAFYADKREDYLAEGREMTNNFVKTMRAKFDEMSSAKKIS